MKIVMGLLIAIVLVIGMIIALPFLIDLNKYQDQYKPLVEEALNTGKTASRSAAVTISSSVINTVKVEGLQFGPALAAVGRHTYPSVERRELISRDKAVDFPCRTSPRL